MERILTLESLFPAGTEHSLGLPGNTPLPLALQRQTAMGGLRRLR